MAHEQETGRLDQPVLCFRGLLAAILIFLGSAGTTATASPPDAQGEHPALEKTTAEQPSSAAEPAPSAIPVDGVSSSSSETKPADRPSPPLIKEIVVTARRTEESIQAVPMSIAVLDSTTLTERGITNTDQLAASVPGLSGMSLGGAGMGPGSSQTSYSMRGQGQSSALAAPGVLSYTAEVADFSSFIFDLENVQVLKGPQGTLFGRNTTGGAILFTPTKPSSDFEGYVKGVAGNLGRRNVDAAIGGAVLGDWLLMRAAGQLIQRDGYTKNLTTGEDTGNEYRYAYRLSIVIRPFENLENYTIGQHERLDERQFSFVFNAYVDRPTTTYWLELGPYLDLQEARGPRRIENDFPNYVRSETNGVINATTWDVGDHWVLKNIFGRKSTPDSRSSGDFDGSRFRILGIENFSSFSQTSDELQVQYNGEEFSLIAGLYYEKQKAKTDSPGYLSAPGSTSVAPIPLELTSGTDGQGQRSRAAFIQVSSGDLLGELMEPLAPLKITLGFRRTQDYSYSIGGYTSILVAGSPIDISSTPAQDVTQRANTWTLTADYELAPDLLGYVSLRQGYKKGGYNPVAAEDRQIYKPEYVRSHELGLKSTWQVGDVQARLNADIFYDDYKDIQRFVFPPGIVPTSIISNAAKASILGADLDLTVVPTTWLDVSLQYAYLRTHYGSYDDPSYGDLSEGDFPNTPRHQLSIAPRLHWSMGGLGNGSAVLSYFRQSAVAFDTVNKPNGDPVTDQIVKGSVGEAYELLNARLAVDGIGGGGLGIALFANNVLDRTYPTGTLNFMGVSIVGVDAFRYAPPRMYGVELSYSF